MVGHIEDKLTVVSVLDAADGNPLMAAAAAGMLSAAELGVVFASLRYSGSVAGLVHRSMTKRAKRSETYTQHSERMRAGYAGLVFGYIAWVELLQQLRQIPAYQTANERSWRVVQEFQLLAAPQSWVNSGRFQEVRVVVPDTKPKQSAVNAVQKHAAITKFEVWNTAAARQLREQNVPVYLVHPYILEGTIGYKELLQRSGVPIVVKSSGSGMAIEWQQQLTNALKLQRHQIELHLAHKVINRQGQAVRHLSAQSRRERFLTALGNATRLIIGYPSELVQIVAEMQSVGIPVRLVALPPRGGHEFQNLTIGYSAGLIAGTLGQQVHPEIPVIEPTALLDCVQSAITLAPGFLGTQSPLSL